MASRIAGITIEIEGNTTKLTKALNDVDKSLRTTQSNLKDVNKLLKMDPGNADLLKQKQELLSRAIADTKSKLDTERQALSQLKEADESPEVREQMAALERQIAADEQALQKLESESKSFGSVAKQQFQAAGSAMQEVGDKVKAAGEKIKSFGQDVTTHVTGPLVAAGAASVAAFNEVDEGMDTIIAKTGATGDAAAEMGEIMNNIATSIPTDFATAGAAVGEVNTRFGLTGDELEKLSAKFVKFANLNGTDVSTAIDTAQAAMAAFGLSAEDASGFLDTLNKAGQDTGISVDKLAQDMTTNAAALKEMGFSASDSAFFIANLNKQGIDSSTVMTGLKKALQNATKDGKSMDEAMAELQTSMANATTDTEAAQMAMDLFGNKAGPALAQAINEGRLSFDALGTSIDDNLGNIDSTFDATLDPIDQFKLTLNDAKIVLAEVGNTIMTAVEPVLEQVSEKIKELKARWDALSPQTQQAIVKAAMLAAAIGPVIMVIGTLVSSIGSIISVAGSLVSGLGSVVGFLGGPLTIAIGAAVAVGVLLYKNWDKIVEWAKKLKEQVGAAWDNLKTKISGAVDNIKNNVTQKWNAIKTTVGNVMNNLKTDVQNKLNNIKQAYVNNGGGIKGIVAASMTAVRQYYATAFNAIDSLTGGKLSAIKAKFSSVFESVKNVVRNAINAIKNMFNFSWSLPKIKLPHISITGKFSLSPPSVPKVSVSWYKKAYDDPILFTRPTVIPTASGYKGFGDGSGAEVVMGLNKLQEMVGGGISPERIYEAVRAGAQDATRTIYLNSRELTRGLKSIGVVFNEG